MSRLDIFAQKLAAIVLSFVCMLTAFTLITIGGYLSFSDYTFLKALKEAAMMYGAILYVGLVFMSVGILLSSLLRSSRASSGAAIAIVFGSFVLGALGAAVPELSFLKYFSPIDWIKTTKLMNEGIRWQEWLLGTAIIVGGIAVAGRVYKRKDFLV